MSDTKLQIALDFLELPRAMDVAKLAVAGGADYIEAGTPLIKSEGLDAVRRLRETFPNKTIIADMKTMDAGKIEAQAAANAGANIITVSGTASLSTIKECVEVGAHYGIEVAVDLLGVEDPVAFASQAGDLGVAWLDVHCPIDQQMSGQDPLAVLKQVRGATDLILAVAGGINSETAALAVAAGADVVIVGGAITKAVDPTQATADILKAIESGQGVASELFKRVSADTIRQALQAVRTSNISDGSHRLECLEGIKPLAPGQFACGPAVTVRTFPGDWAKPVEAIDIAQAGDMIVIDACGKAPAIWGELATESAKAKGISGLVVDGAVRDTADIRKLGFDVWTRHVTSHAGDPYGQGEINQPIKVGGQTVAPGDWIVADDDGVMVLPKAKAVEMANRAANVLEAENRIRQEIRDGKGTLGQVINLLRWEKQGGGGAITG
ncbi:MAG: bifunctional hexulose-6-phosphate synthase/ribonuclease regulator [Phycisphaerales bacterium]|jgi:3-hexulose-6-phosphate synthase / 6-phospho-3-hexuloisomerase|nr:bifunctional hexulose-6-phosphate synthase/ribonuclease regulator [Phycisphaerales bacterium]